MANEDGRTSQGWREQLAPLQEERLGARWYHKLLFINIATNIMMIQVFTKEY